MRKFHCLAQVAAAATLLCSSPSYAALAEPATSAVVYLKTDPGSAIGSAIGAPVVTWTHGVDGLFSSSNSYRNGVSITYDANDDWIFSFAAPSGAYDPFNRYGPPLRMGFYDQVQRFPYNSPTQPGMDISGAGWSSDTISGWFRVLDVSYRMPGVVNSLAVDFRQYGESLNMTGPSLYGSLRFNSAIPINAVPEPASYAMLLAGLVLTASLARRLAARSGQRLRAR